jgi:hypothetical protein
LLLRLGAVTAQGRVLLGYTRQLEEHARHDLLETPPIYTLAGVCSVL